MRQTKPILCIGAAVCLLAGTWPLNALAQLPPTEVAVCVRGEENPPSFQAMVFSEMRNAHTRTENEIGFFEQNLHAIPPANRLYEDSLVRSHLISKEIPLNLSDEYTTSRVVLEKEVVNENCRCTDCELVEFQVALDCNTCTRSSSEGMKCIHNNAPQWINVDFNPAINPLVVTGNRKRVEIDILNMNLIGSQLCWRGIFRSQKRKNENQNCTPTLRHFSMEYQSVKSGEYTRSSPMPVANMAFVASYITPKSFFDTEASRRAVTGLEDYTRRGMVRAYELYNPENPQETTRKLKWSLKSGISNPMFLDYGGVRYHQHGPLQRQGTWAPIETDVFDDFFKRSDLNKCNTQEGMLIYDLNRSNSCTDDDIIVLKNWIIGLETYAARAARAGGAIPTAFDLSTPAVFTNNPLVYPPWVRLGSQTEINNYRRWKSELNRPDMALILLGSTTGEIYGIDAGLYRADNKDGCLESVNHYRGYFKPYAGCQREDGSIKRHIGALASDSSAGKVKTVYYPWALRPNYLYEYNTKYYGTEYQSKYSVLRPSLNASAVFMDVDFMSPRANALPEFEDASRPLSWDQTDFGEGFRAKGGHSFIIMSSGPTQSILQVLAIGVNSEKPDENPRLYLIWELNFKTNPRIQGYLNNLPQGKPRFSTNSSRHAPLVGRFMFNRAGNPLSTGIAKWLAVVGSDYRPGVDSDGNPLAGVVYFMDVYTGDLLKLTPQIPGSDWAGFVLLEPGEGVGGEIVGLDLQHQSIEVPKPDPDGIYDVIYIPTTKGRVYRVNLLRYNSGNDTALFGDAYKKCKVIDIPQTLKGLGLRAEEAELQGIHSNMAVYQRGKKVRIYVGTGDNPDVYDKKIDPTAGAYYVLAFELDESSVGTADCAAAELLWAKALPAGEKVWGGVSVTQTNVAVGTATGGSSDMCGLDARSEGALYVLEADTGIILKSQQAQIVASPVAFDGHFLYVDVKTQFGIVAAEGISGWNNSPDVLPTTTPPIMKVLEQIFEKNVRRTKPPYVEY